MKKILFIIALAVGVQAHAEGYLCSSGTYQPSYLIINHHQYDIPSRTRYPQQRSFWDFVLVESGETERFSGELQKGDLGQAGASTSTKIAKLSSSKHPSAVLTVEETAWLITADLAVGDQHQWFSCKRLGDQPESL